MTKSEQSTGLGVVGVAGDELHRCPICAEPFKPNDICASDINEGTCHAECLEGSPVVDLETGEETGGKVDTYPYSEVSPSMTPEPGREALAAIVADEPAAWAYEYHDFGNVWPRRVILNRPDGGANPPTKHHGSDIRNVRALYSAAQLAKVEARATTAEARAEAAEERVAVLEEALRQMLPPDLPWKRDADGVLIHHKVAAINDARNALKREIQNADQ